MSEWVTELGLLDIFCLQKGRNNGSSNERGGSSNRFAIGSRGISHGIGHGGGSGKVLAITRYVIPVRVAGNAAGTIDIGTIIVADAIPGVAAALVETFLAIVGISVALGRFDWVANVGLDRIGGTAREVTRVEGISGLTAFVDLTGTGLRAREVAAPGVGIASNINV